MGSWHFYFLAKTFLHYCGRLHVDPLLNFAFLVFLLLPLPKKWQGLKRAKTAVSFALGALLLWHDSWLPSLDKTFSFLTDSSVAPSVSYIAQFLMDSMPWVEIFAVAALVASLAWVVKKGVRLAPITAIAFLAVAAERAAHAPAGLNMRLGSFYRSEALRTMIWPGQPESDFDIVIVHVCSLSWEDLASVGLENHPFFKKFDALFSRFNTVTTYSNPAALRLLQSGCGQKEHDALYRVSEKDCYLLEGLKNSGFEVQTAYNHDGVYSDFARVMETWGRAPRFQSNQGITVAKRNFDGSSIYSDSEVLNRWWSQRVARPAPRAALYYNSVTLHEGSHFIGRKEPAGRFARYRSSVEFLLADLEKFMATVEASGRSTAVFFIPEHGAALVGSGIQSPGLRDIPVPSITRVPVGLRLIGPRWTRAAKRAELKEEVSYQAVSYLISALIKWPPMGFSPAYSMKQILEDAPRTPFVAENDDRVVLDGGAEFYLREGRNWMALPWRSRELPTVS